MTSLLQTAVSSPSSAPSDLARAVRWTAQVLLLAAGYYLAASFGLSLASQHGSVTLVWPSAGLALGALLIFGRKLWPGVALGVVLINLTNSLEPWLPYLGLVIGNTLAAVVGATLLPRVTGLHLNLDRPRDVLSLVGIGALGCSGISATIGAASMLASGSLAADRLWMTWLYWWLGDAGGVLIVTPLLLMGVYGTPRWSTLARKRELRIVIPVLLVTTTLTFFVTLPDTLAIVMLLPFFPILVWTADGLGSRATTLASFVIISSATLATAWHIGPFRPADADERTLLLWTYSMLIAITALTLAAVVEQRDVADRRRRDAALERLQADQDRLLMRERERLTREMHDGLGGQLVSLLSLIERGVGTRRELAEALRRALDEIRIVTDSLDSTTDLPLSLGKLRSRFEPLLRRNGIELVWLVDDDPRFERFRADAVLHLLRIIQEALTNIMRHAGARQVEVRVYCEEDERLNLSIQDDGTGLSSNELHAGRGIKSMHSRAKELGAQLHIESANAGTLVELSIPIPSDPAN